MKKRIVQKTEKRKLLLNADHTLPGCDRQLSFSADRS
jgi:hypothetical protein